jgi:formylglycine-generating enzyme required for sulfatase activity
MKNQKLLTKILLLISINLSQEIPQLNSTLPSFDGGDIAAYPIWSNSLSLLRNSTLNALGKSYSEDAANSAYNRAPYSSWLNNASLFLHVMSFDQRLSSPAAKNNFTNWTASRLIDDTLARIPSRPDAVVLWAAAAFSPLLGLDNRSFLEVLRSSLPGSISASSSSSFITKENTTKEMNVDLDRLVPFRLLVESFHKLSPPIPVLLAVIPWDNGTTPEAVNNDQDDEALSHVLPYIVTNCSLDGLFFADSGQAPYTSSFDNSSGTLSYYVVAADGLMPENATASPNVLLHPLAFQQLSQRLGTVLPFNNIPTDEMIDSSSLSLSSYRYFERRHVSMVSMNWARGFERTSSIFSAFLEGGSISVSENVFGFTNKVCPREGQLIARACSILSFVSGIVRAGPPALASYSSLSSSSTSSLVNGNVNDPLPNGIINVDWLPLLPATNFTDGSIIVSLFTASCPLSINIVDPVQSPGLFNNCSVFLLANTANTTSAVALNVSIALDLASASGSRETLTSNSVAFFDLYSGLQIQTIGSEDDSIINITMEPISIRAILSVPNNGSAPLPILVDFLSKMANLTEEPLSNFSSTWAPSQQTMLPSNSTAGFSSPPPGMVLVSGMLSWFWTVSPAWPAPFDRPDAAYAISGDGVDVQYPWESIPSANHSSIFDVASFYIDQNLVTNQDFLEFITTTGYNASVSESDPANFLRHWVLLPNGTFTFNAANDDGPRPVIWVSVSDASAFCSWKGRRLPTEWELQYAGQAQVDGTSDYRVFPWGNQSCEDITPRPCAIIDSSQTPRSPDSVGIYPPSPLGIFDLVGLVWHLTDSIFIDEFTSSLILRGGSLYRPIAAMPSSMPELGPLPSNNFTLYAPQALSLIQHLRLPFITDAGQRNGFTGFRCVADSAISHVN